MTSWIESFLEATEDYECAAIWRQWAAISAIAAVLERKVWATTTKGDLYPNMYVVIVGPAGTGKSLAINAARQLLQQLEDPTGAAGLHLAPTSVTMASLADELSEAKRVVLRHGQNPPAVEFNSLAIVTSELSSFMHEYDKELMGGLTDIWDGWAYSQRRRGGGIKIKIAHPQLNILTGSTPSNLLDFMPERAWDQGFASRLIMVYSGERHTTDIFAEVQAPKINADLVHDLRLIADLYGKMVFTPEAVAAFRAWREAGEKPAPEHPKLVDYCSRRTAHLIKLCMVASASRGTDRNITEDDFEIAKNWLLGAEMSMPDVFAAGSGGGDSRAMDETWHYILTECAKAKDKRVPDHQVIHFVRERVPSHSVLRVLEIMKRDGSIKSVWDKGHEYYEPGPRQISF